VLEAIMQRLPVTLELGLLSIIFSVIISVPLGVYAAIRYNTIADLLVSLVAFAGVAMPAFWLAILLIYLFTLQLSLLPGSGYVAFTRDPWLNLKYMAMPVFVLSVESVALLMRQVRSEMLEVLNQDYVRTAQAKGLKRLQVLADHALRNALLPLATILGLRIARILSGAVVIENVFALPGLGRLAVESIFNRDFPVLQGIVLIFALMVLLTNLLTDIVYSLIDPRIRYGT
jgi:peptide/nickel transport system permease protein